ncbi:unnamed protein product [Phyllotreta striolata]|uniref:Uncharacterized protein n=1 Tax=Phyllotreta striolata TaxID=444603 RepID=A0A9N9TRX6_PHYSR|nr:unnamed protein product [Phyllotreta striolata]
MAEADGPKDKFYIVYFICFLHGIGVLITWNMFINARDDFYKYYDEKENAGEHKGEELPPYWQIFKTAFPQLLNIILVFIVTLTVFPSLEAEVYKSDPNFFIPDEYYADIMCFLTFNIFATTGSFLPVFFVWPKPKWVWIPVTLRFLYIPLLLFCNYQIQQAERTLPVLFNDYVFFILGATMALTNGYFATISSMYAPNFLIMTDTDGPKDKFYIVYFICLLNGVGVLTAWNTFINARDYFKEYKLSDDYIGYHYPHGDHFMQYLAFFSNIPALVFMWVNIFVRLKSAIIWRIILGIGLMIVIIAFTLVMAAVNTSHCPNFFFVATMISVFVMN